MNKETPRRLLVADDNETLRRLFSTVLSGSGYTVDAAANGSEALEMLKRSEYDLVITDVNMPGLDGIGFYRAAVKHDPGIKDRFIFMTGQSAEDIRPYVSDIDRRFLSKPFPLADLLGLVESFNKPADAEKEKREDERHETIFECKVLIETMEQKLLRATLQDFSQNGLKVSCSEAMLKEGSVVNICMNINYMTMVREARVVWTKDLGGQDLSVGLYLDEPIPVSSIMGLMTVSSQHAKVSREMHMASM